MSNNDKSQFDRVNGVFGKIGNFAKNRIKKLGKDVGKKIRKKVTKLAIKAVKTGLKLVGKLLIKIAASIGWPLLIALLIGIPIFLLLISLPGGEQDDVDKYKRVAQEVGIDFEDLLAFDMAYYDNDLKGKNPEDSLYFLIDVEVEKFKLVDECVKKDKNGKCIQTKPKKVVTYHTTAHGKKEIQNLMTKLGLNNQNGLLSNIDTLKNTDNINLTIHPVSLEKAMDAAKFTKDQKAYALAILDSGTLEMYADVGSSGFSPGTCFGTVSPNGKAKVSSKVESYTPLILKYAKQQGIEMYTEWLKAMMQQETGGSGKDPMQSSESGHNTKYCNSRNCIQDPEYSIEVGVKTFKEVIQKANGDMMLAVQSYNFGPNFIAWVEDRGGKYSVELAHSYSSTYLFPKHHMTGDPDYAGKILKNYDDPGCTTVPSFDGNLATGTDVGNFIATVGTKWIGHSTYLYGGGRKQSEIDRGIFDCSSFVHWAYGQAKINLGPLTGVSTKTLNKMGKQISLSEARPGDLVFFDTVSGNKDSHVTIYIGNGNFMGAQSKGIGVFNLQNSYWKSHFSGHVRRILP